jgi:hypothetical protein
MSQYDQSLFIRGFNNGYLLDRFEPTLLASLLRGLPLSNLYVSGLSKGQGRNQMERTTQELEAIAQLRQEAGKDRARGR